MAVSLPRLKEILEELWDNGYGSIEHKDGKYVREERDRDVEEALHEIQNPHAPLSVDEEEHMGLS